MTCLCDKLQAENYSDITEAEADILRRVLEKAPHLFTARRPSFSGLEGRVEAAPDCVTKSVRRRPRSSSNSTSRIRKRQRQTPSQLPSNQVQHPACEIKDISQQQPSDAVCTIVQPSSCVSHSTAVEKDISTAAELEKTYRYQDIDVILSDNGGGTQGRAEPFDVVVDIFLAIERSDQIIEIRQEWKRIYCYALARLHPKGTSIDIIVQRVQHAVGNVQTIRRKVYHYLRLGNRWEAIIDLFESICKATAQPSEIRLTGILCVLGSGSLWERTPMENCRTALASLRARTDIYERVTTCSIVVNMVLRDILDANSFVHISDPHTFMSNSKLLASNPGSGCNNNIAKSVSMTRGFHVTSGAASSWKAPSIAAASEGLPELVGIHSEDPKLLLVLLCFLASSEIPLDLLFRGASPRRRWSENGEIEETDALYTGLQFELVHLLSSIPKLSNALANLCQLSAISRISDQTYMVDRAIVASVTDSLPPGLHSFWRLQALVIAYRAIPWKYLEPRPPHVRELFIPHLRHTLQEVRNHESFQQLAANTRTDLVLTLVEASRFPKIEWKQFAISQAKEAMGSLNDEYLRSCIAQKECLLYRITGALDQAGHALENASFGQGQLDIGAGNKMHVAFGQTIIQRALNHIQVEELAMATRALDAWHPLCEPPSRIEKILLFRKFILLNKISRFQGNFRESLAHLERSRNTADQCKDLFFDEDRCDLVCSLADTLQELDNPVSAEQYLRIEIARQGQERTPALRLLKLALAECLFAQGQYGQAEALCSEVQSCQSLPKMEKLRLSIVQAKLCHVNSDWEGAFRHWTDAMVAVRRFTMTNGHTTRIILLSMSDILRRQGNQELELKSRNQFATLEKLAGSAGAMYWVAGLRHWLNYLELTDRSRRSRI